MMQSVLVVDDDPAILGLLRQTLESGGYSVAGAGDGQEALRVLREQPVALVIIDIIMPKKQGLETIQEVRRDFPEVKIIAISGGSPGAEDALLKVAQVLGALRTFNKPFYPEELLKAVREALGDEETHRPAT